MCIQIQQRDALNVSQSKATAKQPQQLYNSDNDARAVVSTYEFNKSLAIPSINRNITNGVQPSNTDVQYNNRYHQVKRPPPPSPIQFEHGEYNDDLNDSSGADSDDKYTPVVSIKPHKLASTKQQKRVLSQSNPRQSQPSAYKPGTVKATKSVGLSRDMSLDDWTDDFVEQMFVCTYLYVISHHCFFI